MTTIITSLIMVIILWPTVFTIIILIMIMIVL